MVDSRIMAAAQKWFGDLGPEVVATMYAVAMAESGGNPGAVNNTAYPDRPNYRPPGPGALPEYSLGPWQVNIGPGGNEDLAGLDLFDVDGAARAARVILDRQGVGAWSTYTKGSYRPYYREVTGGEAPERGPDMGDEDYEFVANQIAGYLTEQKTLAEMVLDLQKDSSEEGHLSPSEARQKLISMGLMSQEITADALGRVLSPQDVIYNRQRDNRSVLDDLYEEAYAIDRNAADADFGWRISDKKRAELSGLNQGFAPAPYQFQMQDNGDLLIFNPNTGKMENGGNFPNAVGKTVAQDRNGNLISYDPYTKQSEVLVPDFGFPDLDPRVKFETETMLSAARVEADWAGVELAARGQEIEALAADNANMIATGQMIHTEARLNLDRYDKALTQRREERQQVIDYGVTRESLRTLPSGEVVTRLPFAKQTAEILNRFIPGGGFSEQDFQLGVTAVNPEQAAGDLMQGSAYDSPIPGIIQGLQSNRGRINEILANTPTPGANTEAVLGGQ